MVLDIKALILVVLTNLSFIGQSNITGKHINTKLKMRGERWSVALKKAF